MRRPHKFWAVIFAIAGWFIFKHIGDDDLKYRPDGWFMDVVSAYWLADICYLICARLWTGMPFFRFRDLFVGDKTDAA